MRHMPWSPRGTRLVSALRLLCMMLAAALVIVQAVPVQAEEPTEEAALPATEVKFVDILDDQVLLMTDGAIGKYRHFRLGAPPRLAVDIYGVKPGLDAKAYSLNSVFKRLRVGEYPNKTRFVFDASGEALPNYTVSSTGQGIQVVWGESPAVGEPIPAELEGVPVTVKDIDFKAQDGQSTLTLELTGPAAIIEPVAAGDMVRFGVKNAAISRALRRAIDPSGFPSAIRLVTPYTVFASGVQEVRFAVELKGPVSYQLEKEGSFLRFIVDDGPFAEVVPPSLEEQRVPVTPPVGKPMPMVGKEPVKGTMAVPLVDTPSTTTVGAKGFQSLDQKPLFTGQKISLVFDDANIRNILQLIAEVSNLNIIAGDDVKGTITLRLVDVPWDQALQLVMDIKGLGMLREGNVVRIMPKDQIRKMQQEQFTASRALEKLEDLITEVVTVNYTDVGSVASKSRERLTERGSIIEDVRDKKLIISDIPAVVAEVKKLIALLDTPERQVLIEARIVEASSTFSRDLGVKWGLSYDNNPSGTNNTEGNIGLGGSFAILPDVIKHGTGAGIGSSFTFGRTGIDKLVLDLRISALEQSGHGRIVSTPRVTTLNGEEAEISQGTEIPYQSVSDEGTKTEFKKAELSLKVTPEINPDGSIFLEIEAKNDSRGATVSTGLGSAPAIDTKQAETKVLVQDGETTVIGGIFIEDKSANDAGVPWLQHIPLLGHLFKSQSVSEERRELLIFITPRILD